jgi:exopolysaccharide biosynthesis polyprenyl glycosylphosphotransferase
MLFLQFPRSLRTTSSPSVSSSVLVAPGADAFEGNLETLPRATVSTIQTLQLARSERLAKRTLDIAVAGAALLMLAPLMTLIAIAVKLDSRGPIIFKQRRAGLNGMHFLIYKFRTMKVLEDGPSIVQANKGDTRVTGLGHLLRQTSVDELPQLINVLKGDMSIVGPRPHPWGFDTQYSRKIPNYTSRHRVNPGITGWAQVHGYRGATPTVECMAKRIELDLWYINNWSIILDLKIIIRTCFEVIRQRNAY